jgi:hypothetical protein
MTQIGIKTSREEELTNFLAFHEFQVEELEGDVLRVQREGELPVYLVESEGKLYFELDLGNITEILSKDLLLDLLALNTEILPVSVGLDTTNVDDPRLVLGEARELGDLSGEELLAVFDAFEQAEEKVGALLEAALKA